MLLTYKENVHSTQMYIPLKPLFSRHKGIGVQFTDEPTGNLDVASAQTVVQMLAEASNEYNQTIIMVTHDKQMAEYADKLLTIVDGHVSMGVDDTIAEGNG